MLKRLAIAGITGLAMFASTAFASEDPISTRQNIMKSNGAAAGALFKMVKGEIEYDALTAELALREIFAGAVAFPTLFPEGSETGGDTRASPEIWKDKAGFEATALKLETAALAAIPAAKSGLDELKATLGSVAENCQACHEKYRLEKN